EACSLEQLRAYAPSSISTPTHDRARHAAFLSRSGDQPWAEYRKAPTRGVARRAERKERASRAACRAARTRSSKRRARPTAGYPAAPTCIREVEYLAARISLKITRLRSRFASRPFAR